MTKVASTLQSEHSAPPKPAHWKYHPRPKPAKLLGAPGSLRFHRSRPTVPALPILHDQVQSLTGRLTEGTEGGAEPRAAEPPGGADEAPKHGVLRGITLPKASRSLKIGRVGAPPPTIHYKNL